MANMKDTWSRIETWLQSHAESVAAALQGPATAEAIADAEGVMGFSLPEALCDSYLQQDGLEYGEQELNIFPAAPGAFDDMAFCLLPIARVSSEWTVWKELVDGGDFEGEQGEPDDGIAVDWWSDGWIPVAGNGGGDFICVDMKPAAGGTVGQVICAWHDMEERKLLSPSWDTYLASLADELEAGGLTYSPDDGVVRQ